MRKAPKTAEELCEELLGRRLDQVDAQERHVLEHIASGQVGGFDAQEKAALHASYGHGSPIGSLPLEAVGALSSVLVSSWPAGC